MSFVNPYRTRAPLPQRAGLTLVEMLVAMTCTILLMFAITQTFQSIGEVSAKGRAAIEMSTQLRGVQHRLHKDFESLTVPVRPWPEAGAGEGYIEIYEGTNNYDGVYQGTQYDLFGDFDDIWAMTIRSTGEPFVGRYGNTMITSHLAEVIWFCGYSDRDFSGTYTSGEPINLHRRVLLIRPDLNNASGNLGVNALNYGYYDFLQQNDLSVRWTTTGNLLAANTLADLTQRENRFGHVIIDTMNSGARLANFPYSIDIASGLLNQELVLGWNRTTTPKGFTGDRTGEDLMLSNALAADIRVYDRTAAVVPWPASRTSGYEALVPGDLKYNDALTAAAGAMPASSGYEGFGAYVDLDYVRYHSAANSEFSGLPVTKSGFGNPGLQQAVYDTLSYTYEHDGVNQDGDAQTDEAENGLDDDSQNGVDDVGERETSPPYPVPLRGVQVRIRVLEPETSQVRQATIVQDFIPE